MPGKKTGGKRELRGGTQHGEDSTVPPTGMPGGTNSLGPSGPNRVERPQRYSHGTRTESQDEPEELFEGSRRPSPAVAKEKARDAAHVDTTHGVPAAPGNPRQQDQTDPTGQADSDGAFVTEGSLEQREEQ